MRLCVIAIPIGLMLAALLSTVVIPMIVITKIGTEIVTVVSFSPYIYTGAVLFALITAFIGAVSPVKKASGISPVEAVKYTYVEWKNI